MATKIVTKNSSTASAVPTASDLVQGELAVNVADKRLFTEDNGGSIVELGTNPSTIDINAGTIDGTVIGGSSAAAGTFTTGQFNTSVNVNGTVTADGLSVGTTSDAYSQILINSSTTGESELRMGDTDTDAGSIAYTNSNDTMTFRAAAGARMSLNSTGIDVTGTATMDGLVVDGKGILTTNYSFGQSNYHLKMGEDSGDSYLGNVNGSAFLATGNYYGSNQYTLTNGATALSGVYLDGSSGIQLFSEAGLTANSTVTRKQRLNVATNGDISFYEDTGTTAKFFWDASAESLGIGTSSPSAKVHAVGDNSDGTNLATSASNAKVRFQNNSGSSLSAYQGYTGNSSWYTQIANSAGTSSYDLSLNPYGGNVGIGTSSPSSYYSTTLVVDAPDEDGITVVSPTTGTGYLMFADGTSGNERYRGYINYGHANDDMQFATSGLT
ncbi:hypothetical protein, partial [Pseudoalteromonas marina]|uniref:hypothetical protein n=1 Tax=Pseudoalteromonas marina TaxID=267375 RepID=UPI003C3EB839